MRLQQFEECHFITRAPCSNRLGGRILWQLIAHEEVLFAELAIGSQHLALIIWLGRTQLNMAVLVRHQLRI